jgi:hypothetical protein
MYISISYILLRRLFPLTISAGISHLNLLSYTAELHFQENAAFVLKSQVFWLLLKDFSGRLVTEK